MEDSGFRKAFFKIKNLYVRLTLCEARAWLLKVCLLRKLVPKTLRPRNRDPRAHQEGYTEEERERWKKAQTVAGLRMVEEAKEREAARLTTLQLRLRAAEAEQHLLSDAAWLILRNKIQQLKATRFKLSRREQGRKLRDLMLEDGRRIPQWLDHTVGSRLEGTALILEGAGARGEEEQGTQGE